MVTVTDVALAASHKKAGIVVKKVVQLTSIVANNLAESTNLYKNKVLRTLSNDAGEFVFSGSAYTRVAGDAYSVVSLARDTSKKYIEAFPQSTQGVHYVKIVDGEKTIITKEELAGLLTKSAAEKLLENSNQVYNAKNDTYHAAIYRAYKAESLHSLKINGETYIGQFTA